ncbi:MAG: hypothetical protein Fur0037_26070 [Planctomycetota bacterium]
MTRLQAGLSGCGATAKTVVEAAMRAADWEIPACYDPDPAAARDLGAGEPRRSFDDLLAAGVDFVVLTGPVSTHEEQVRKAAEQGVHCLVHAPFAPDLAAARRMVESCEIHGVKLGVVVPEQEDPLVEQIRLLIDEDYFGPITAVQTLAGDDRLLRSPPPAGDWRRDPAVIGSGAFLRLCTPHLHLCTWLCARPIVELAAVASSGFSVLDQDAVSVSAVLRGGALWSMTGTHLARGRMIRLSGTDGEAMVDGHGLLLRGRSPVGGYLVDHPRAKEPRLFTHPELALRLQALKTRLELHGRFARWLDDRDDFPCTGEQAALDFAAVDAVREAVRSGARVGL